VQGAVAEPPTPVSLSAAIVRSSKPLDQELRISGSIEQGWHVYAMQQFAGAPAGTEPQTRHDPGFDLDTPFYSQAFTVKVPLHGEIAGPVPVSVRFQACSDRECLPPKTLQLQAALITPEGG
jgi:thiol:disulfide interchange protein